MPRQYPSGFRDEMARRMLAGEPVLTICSDTGVPEQTLHRWKHRALIDAGLAEGIDSTESAALRAAHKRIRYLEKELQLVKDAPEIYDFLAVDSKGGRGVSVELVSRRPSRSATRAAGIARPSFIKRVKPSPPTNRRIRRLLRDRYSRQN